MKESAHNNLSTLEDMRETSLLGGGENRIEAQHARGKLTARERIDLLLDEGSFEEFDMLKKGRTVSTKDSHSYPGDGVVEGHGTIDSREVFIFSQDFTVEPNRA